jgi:hypothetical protein
LADAKAFAGAAPPGPASSGAALPGAALSHRAHIDQQFNELWDLAMRNEAAAPEQLAALHDYVKACLAALAK